MSALPLLFAGLLAAAQAAPASPERPVAIGMYDAMRFAPDRLLVARGQAIRFDVQNRGKVRHEIVIGTADEIAQHRRAMLDNPHMAHAAPNMAHVAPGRRARLVWRFDAAGAYEYACLLPGHYEAGMRGSITVRDRSEKS